MVAPPGGHRVGWLVPGSFSELGSLQAREQRIRWFFFDAQHFGFEYTTPKVAQLSRPSKTRCFFTPFPRVLRQKDSPASRKVEKFVLNVGESSAEGLLRRWTLAPVSDLCTGCQL